MVLKGLFAAILGAALIAGGAVRAADYRPDEYFSLDLPKAVLSPKRLGPPSEFAPVAVEAKGDVKSEASGVIAGNDAKKVAAERVRVAKSASRGDGRVAETQREKPRGAGRTRLAHRNGNPLNAQAMDTRIQKWPCNPDNGGICAWRH
jgi:hypothetical protein